MVGVTKFMEGDWVRVVIEGAVTSVGNEGLFIQTGVDTLSYVPFAHCDLLTPVEPPDGSIVVDADDDVWQSNHGHWFQTGCEESLSWRTLSKDWAPLTVLREGKGK